MGRIFWGIWQSKELSDRKMGGIVQEVEYWQMVEGCGSRKSKPGLRMGLKKRRRFLHGKTV